MKRLSSESKQPGMQASRHCPDCNVLLPPDGKERCIACRPVLSELARTVGATRRREQEEIRQTERNIKNLERMIRKMYRRLK